MNDTKNNRVELDEIIKKANEQNETINELKTQIKGEKKDFWDRFKIFGGAGSALILAVVAIFGSIFIPKSINEQSLETTQISQLSQFIPKLYGNDNEVRAAIIGMSLYGAPAVPSLLTLMQQLNLHLDENEPKTAIYKKMTNQKELARFAIVNIGKDAKEELSRKINYELATLSEYTSSSVKTRYLTDIFTMLTEIGIDKHWLSFFGFTTNIERSLEGYFIKISKFTSNRDNLNHLNGAVIKALSSVDYPLKNLNLKNLFLNNQDLGYTDFTDTDLSNSKFQESYLMNSKFKNANLNSADFRNAFFVLGSEKSDDVLKFFTNFSEAKWQDAKFDHKVKNLLTEIEKGLLDEAALLVLAGKMRDE